MVSIGTQVKFKGDLGLVRYAGETHFAPGVWIGVELEEPNGKNDGSVESDRYFQCPEKHGLFVRESALEIVDEDYAEGLNAEKVRTASKNASRAPSRIHSRSSDTVPSDENTRLRSIIQKLQDKLMAMRSDIDRLQGELQAAQSQNSDLENRVTKGEEDLEIAAIDKETLEEQNELLRHEIQSLTMQNKDILREIKSLKEELKMGSTVEDPSLLNESTDSLIKRNDMLKEALIKLRDHTDNEKSVLTKTIDNLEKKLGLQSNLELEHKEISKKLEDANIIIADLKAHIETSIHSTEIIESLTDKNSILQEENQQLKSSVKELEDLRKVEEEIEKFHVETESQLQQEIVGLKDLLQGQEKDLSSLEGKNKELHIRANELQLLNEKLREAQVALSSDSRARNSTPQGANYMEIFELNNNLLKEEITFKEKELKYLEEIYGESESIALTRSSFRIQKYSKIYQILATSLNSQKDDTFISLLNIKLKLALQLFSAFLDHAAMRCKFFKKYKDVDLGDLESITSRLVSCIEDQDFRDIPDLRELESKIREQISEVESAFVNKLELNYNLQSEVYSAESLLLVIDLLNDSEAGTQFVFPSVALSQLLHLTTERREKLCSILKNAKLIDEEMETSKTDMFSSVPRIEEFIAKLISATTVISTEGNDMSPDIELLLDILENHKDDKFKWSVLKPEENRWMLKESLTGLHNSQEFSALQEDLSSLKYELEKKDKQIEELTLKVDVLNSRLSITKEMEIQSRKLKEEVASLSADKEELEKRLRDLSNSNRQLSSELQKARDNALLHNSQFESLLEQRKYNEKAELLSEIHSLRNVVRVLTKRRQTDRSWLRTEIPKWRPFQKTEADELRIIARDLQRTVLNTKFDSIRGD